jgi:lipoprotein-anchoring transpeptidase ErfK/SrfK
MYRKSNYRLNNLSATKSRGYSRKRHFLKLYYLAILLVVILLVIYTIANPKKVQNRGVNSTSVNSQASSTSPTTNSKSAAQASVNASACASNTISQLIVVSISQRHLWACDNATEVYNTAVITGNTNLAADLTPLGTYKIYTKLTNQDLKGCDSTGCWNDPVSYWLPFLENQYGTYGLHDATWRSPNDFGNISPSSSQASHGCVELPLSAGAWIYKWSNIGTTVIIKA